MFVARRNVRARHHELRLALAAALVVAGCSGDRLLQPESDGELAMPLAMSGITSHSISGLGAPVPIDFATYENSHQVVHPSAVSFPSSWHGQRYWMAVTPYPNGNSHVENPSIFGSTTGDDWAPPSGVTNPLETTSRGYLSDPDLVFDARADELRLYYREVVETHHRHRHPKHEADNLYMTRSSDGVHWTDPVALVSDRGRFVVSPAVARRAENDWKLWSVDAGRTGCNSHRTTLLLRQSEDGIAWHAATPVTFTQPGYLPWHLDVQWIPQLDSYWALVAAYPRGRTCTETSLFLATSSDGVTWTTYPSPVLARGTVPEFSTNVYRSTFAFDADGESLTIWLTGATTVERGGRKHAPVLKWSAAVWHTQARALLAHVRLSPITVVPAATYPSFLRELATENALP
jgi:hypothetical protein